MVLETLRVGWTMAGVAAELSLLYGLMVVTSGPIWGAAEWGIPWDWADARLNTYAVLSAIALFLVLSRRSQPDTPEFRDVFSVSVCLGSCLYHSLTWPPDGGRSGTQDRSSVEGSKEVSMLSSSKSGSWLSPEW